MLILEAVHGIHGHPTAEEVYAAVVERCPSISRSTVYRCLNTLAAEGRILRIGVANAPDRYDHTLERHAHFRCSVCGCVCDCILDSFPTVLPQDDFIVEEVGVMVSGVCRRCNEEKEAQIG